MDIEDMLEAIGQLMDVKLAPINMRLAALEQGQKNLEQGQKNLERGQKNLEQRQKNLEQRQKNLEQRQKNLEQKQTEQTEFERGTRSLIENKVMHEIHLIAEQHGDIISRLEKLESRRESSQALRSRVSTLEAVARTHTERIEALEAKAE